MAAHPPFKTILTLIGAAILFGGMFFSSPPDFPPRADRPGAVAARG